VRLFYLIVMLVPVGFPLSTWRNVSDLSPLKITISCRLFGIGLPYMAVILFRIPPVTSM